MVKVRLYGRLAESIGPHVELGGADGNSVAELRERLAAAHPEAAKTLERSRACVDGAIVTDEHRLTSSEQLEFLPPVSGG